MKANGIAVAGVDYGAGGQITALNYFGYAETREYNSLLQMTRQTVPGMMDMEYRYTAGANNGRITSSVDHILNETVNYSYDSLNRLTLAETAGTGGWGQGFSYDGFGNLTTKTATKGSVPVMNVTFNGTTNRVSGGSYDANGNPAILGTVYDMENRILVTNSALTWYVYDPAGKRVMQKTNEGIREYSFYGLGGQKLVTRTCVPHVYQQGEPGEYTVMECGNANNVYFAGKLVKSKGLPVVTDRLGSVRANAAAERFAYYPYGEERGTSADGREKFGTYTRDSPSQDYADQRYYGVGTGRFNVPDPYRASGGAAVPQSWNRYAYTMGDPINGIDPRGRQTCFYVNGELDSCEDDNDMSPIEVDPNPPQPDGPPGDGGSATIFEVGANALKQYGKLFATRLRNGNLSEECMTDIAKLGIGADEWANALESVSINNGIGSTVALASTLPTGSDEHRVAQERNLTVGGQFGNGTSSGTVAWASVNDSRIWINPFRVNPGDAMEGSPLIAMKRYTILVSSTP